MERGQTPSFNLETPEHAKERIAKELGIKGEVAGVPTLKVDEGEVVQPQEVPLEEISPSTTTTRAHVYTETNKRNISQTKH